MKTLLTIFVILIGYELTSAQTHDDIIAGRALEFHRILSLKDKDQWRKFVKENYTKTLIDRPMRAQIANDDGSKSSTTEANKADPIESKVMMFERLNQDFGGSKIISVKPNGDEVEMVLTSTSGMEGTFKFRFDKTTPYLIDAIAVEVGER